MGFLIKKLRNQPYVKNASKSGRHTTTKQTFADSDKTSRRVKKRLLVDFFCRLRRVF
jgi:hypothetical protein